jgi:membrane fusion protein, multidrug efflux system
MSYTTDRTTNHNHLNNGQSVKYLEPESKLQSELEMSVEAPVRKEVALPPAVDEPDEPISESPRRSFWRKGLILPLLGAGAIAAGIFGFHWWQYASTHEETDNATISGHVYQVSARIPGTVTTIPVTDNQQVKQGDLLVRLDPRDYQLKVQQSLAALNLAQKQAQVAQTNISLASQTNQGDTTSAQGTVSGALTSIATAQAAVAEAQAGVPAAEASLSEAEATLQKTQADYVRYQSLYESGAIARQQLDSAQAAYQVAVAQRNSAQQGVSQARAKLSQAQEGIATAQSQLQTSRGGLQRAQAGGVQTEVNRNQFAVANAAIAQAQVNLNEAKLQLSYTNITAPEAGRIGRKTVEVGQRVTAGQPLMAIVGNEVWVTANFKETQVDQIRPGEIVEIKLDAFPGHPFVGRVDSLSPASGAQFSLLPPDNATGNFTKVVQRIPVKIVLDPQSVQGYETQITPGMSAVVSVEVQ